ncbi:MAG: hypothetical protein ABSA23_08440 [Anaerolineales bacterium]|jgi:hypothetical protein
MFEVEGGRGKAGKKDEEGNELATPVAGSFDILIFLWKEFISEFSAIGQAF